MRKPLLANWVSYLNLAIGRLVLNDMARKINYTPMHRLQDGRNARNYFA